MEDLFGLKSRLDRWVWQADAASMPFWRAYPLHAARVLYVLAREIAAGDMNLRAMSLVYTTLLSMVPVLAVGFALLKAFGAHEAGEEMLRTVLEPLGDSAGEIADRIVQFVDRVKVGVLGAVGVGLLLFTVISLMQKIERTFNDIWYVSQHRSFTRRFSDYMSVVVVGPLLIFSSMSLSATVMSQSIVQSLSTTPGVGLMIALGGRLIPYLLAVAAFAFLYVFMPNTRVRLPSALVGALVAALMWKIMGWLFASFIAGSAKYTAVYSVFATLVLFMIFLYLGWMVLLIGSSIAFYHQNPEYLRIRRDRFRMSNRLSERLALHIAYRIAEAYVNGAECWTAGGLAQGLHVPTLAAERILGELERRNLLVRTADDPPGYLPARPPDRILVAEVLRAARERDEHDQIAAEALPAEVGVDRTVDLIERAVDDALAGATLEDLAAADILPRPAAAPEPAAGTREAGGR